MEAELDGVLRARGLGRVSAGLLGAALEGLRLIPRAVDEAGLSLAASKIGGLPDLPPGTVWPASDGRPQAFVAQINLQDVSGYACAHVLPPSGLLSFFYETEPALEDEDEDEYETADGEHETAVADAGDDAVASTARTGCTVLHVTGDLSHLARCQAPASLAEWDRYTACAVAFEPLLTLPAPESSAVWQLGRSDAEHNAYVEVYLGFAGETYARTETPEHRLLGHPYNLEGDARIDSLLAARRQAQGDGSGLDEEELERAAAEWLLLLQLDSDERAGMDWNGGGLIYFCLPRAAVQARDFTAVQATAQFL